MKRIIQFFVCGLLCGGLGWYFGYTRPVAKNQRELLTQYDLVKRNLDLTDAEMVEAGSKIPQYFEDVKRQDETAARFALGAYRSLEEGNTDGARKKLLFAVGSYYRLYHTNGGDTNLLVQIETAAKKHPAIADEIARKIE